MALYVQSCCYADGLKWVEYDAVWLKGDQDHQHQRRFRHNDNTLATEAKTLKKQNGGKGGRQMRLGATDCQHTAFTLRIHIDIQ